MSFALRRACFSVALALAAFACVDDTDEAGGDEAGELACVEYDLEGCTPLFPASYDQVWSQTLVGCAGGSACHAQDGSGGAFDGMTFTDAQASYDHLTAGALVIPGDAQCSPLFIRLATDDPALRMPPGSSNIDDGALCSIATWIDEGAAQP